MSALWFEAWRPDGGALSTCATWGGMGTRQVTIWPPNSEEDALLMAWLPHMSWACLKVYGPTSDDLRHALRWLVGLEGSPVVKP